MFVIVGGQKSASSTLTSVLTRSKACNFLGDAPLFEGAVKKIDNRLRNAFAAAGLDRDVDGDAPGVAFARPNILTNLASHRALAEHFPKARIIVSLRNPLNRTVSAYFHYMRDGAIGIEDIDIGLMRILLGYDDSTRHREIVEMSKYGSALASLIEHFGKSNILLLDYEELIADPVAASKQVLDFAGIDITEEIETLMSATPAPVLQKTPDDISEVVIERAVRGKYASDSDRMEDIRSYYRRDKTRPLGGKSISLRTMAALWHHLSDETDLLARLWPDWAERIKNWYRDVSYLDTSRDFSLNVLKRHPEKTDPGYNPLIEYSIGVVAGSDPFALTLVSPTVLTGNSTRIEGSKYVADPFYWQQDGEQFVFYESRVLPNAIIEVARIDANNNFIPLGPVISEPFHLSYPHIFQHDGQIYMMVESVQDKHLNIYRCDDFPMIWTLHRKIEKGFFADPTPFRHNNQWYVFSGRARQLLIYLMDEDLKSITSHPSNPIDIDPEHHRMGGGIILCETGLYRPSQRNHPTYGYCLDLHKITKLTPLDYEEEVACSPFLPRIGQFDRDDWSQMIHHIHLSRQSDGSFVGVIDGRDRTGIFTF